jgi:hypothetical protein
MIRLKANSPLTDLEVFQFISEILDDPAGVKGAVISAGAKPNQHPSVEPECRDLVADAFFSAWRDGMNRLSQPLERDSLVLAQRGKIFVHCRRLALWLFVHERSAETYRFIG